MRMVSYNIMNGGEGRADPLAEVILAQRPDIVALHEATDLAVLERIAARLEMDNVQAVGEQSACAILSRWTIRESINHGALRAGANALLEATIIVPDASEWIVGVGSDAMLEVFADHRKNNRPHILAASFEDGSVAPMLDAGYVDTLPDPDAGTFTTQRPERRVDCILTHGIDKSRIRSAWVERDRLAKYASDHFPIGAQIG